MNRKVVRIHNPQAALPSCKKVRICNNKTSNPGFSFPGIEAYSTRSMTDRGGVTIVADCGNARSLRVAHAYYRSIGLGPDDLVLVSAPDGDLYQAILHDEMLCRMITRLVREEGYKIEFFCTRDSFELDFLREIGLDWTDTVSHPPELSGRFNNKAWLRKWATVHKFGHLFPSHRIVRSKTKLVRWARKMLRQHREIVIKPPAWASGSGMVFGSDMSVVELYMKQFGGVVPDGTIIEESLGAGHQAMSIVVRFHRGTEVDRWWSEQECPQKDSSVVHEGSILGSMPHVTGEDVIWMNEATAPLYALLLEEYPNLTGIINFDCARDRNGNRYILECNARVTFSTYLHDIRVAIRQQILIAVTPVDYAEATCLVRKVVPTKARDFDAVAQVLGSSLLTNSRGPGVIPIVLGCLSTSGYCYLVAIGNWYSEVIQIMAEARQKLGA